MSVLFKFSVQVGSFKGQILIFPLEFNFGPPLLHKNRHELGHVVKQPVEKELVHVPVNGGNEEGLQVLLSLNYIS